MRQGMDTMRPAARLASVANDILTKYIETLPIVYGQGEGAGKSANWIMNGPDREVYRHTHSAKLIDIQELPKLPCDHEVNYHDGYELKNCIKCNVKLKATWSPA